MNDEKDFTMDECERTVVEINHVEATNMLINGGAREVVVTSNATTWRFQSGRTIFCFYNRLLGEHTWFEVLK